MASIFERYPHLNTLRGKIPDALIENDVRPKAEIFETLRPETERLIPTSFLSDVFPREVDQEQITIQNFLGRWGNISVEEVCKICLIVSWLKPRAIFEFGTYNGMTTLQMVKNAPEEVVVYTLDVPPEEAPQMTIDLIDRYVAEKAGAFSLKVGHYFNNSPYAPRIKQLWGDSTRFDFSPYRNSMDLVYVDAGHSYACVRSDTENALNMLKSQGVILWHDYLSVLNPDVTQCLYEYAKGGLKIHNLRGTRLAVHYRKG
jgi:predicted O-methyltransferase YrrM